MTCGFCRWPTPASYRCTAAGDPQLLLATARESFRPQAEQQQVSIQIAASTQVLPVLVDHERMLQVLGNLISNAPALHAAAWHDRAFGTQRRHAGAA